MAIPTRSQNAQQAHRSTPAIKRLPPMENRCILNNRYQILELLGHGTWGACYSAKALYGAADHIVAVKCIPKQGFSKSKLALINRELRFHKRVSDIGHRNILKFIEHGEDDEEDITFIVTELCAKGDLFASVNMHRLGGRHAKIRRKMLQIIDGVQAMHENGIYHRDLKPENVFVREDKSIAVGDFGFATDERLSDETRLGTVRYMSPEVLGGLYLRLPSYRPPPSDVWAIGVIFLNMITGRSCWEKACLSDINFRYYVKEREKEMHGLKLGVDFFSMLFDMPDDTVQLLNDIFTLSPSSRIKLPALRERISNMTSFGSGKVKPEYQPREPDARGSISNERFTSSDLSADTIATETSNPACSIDIQDSSELDKSFTTLDTPTESETRHSKASMSSSLLSKNIGMLCLEDDNGVVACKIDSEPFDRSSDSDKTLHKSSKAAVSVSLVQSPDASDDSDEDSGGPETPETRATEDANFIEQDIENLDLSITAGAAETDWAKVTEMWSPKAPQNIPNIKRPNRTTYGLLDSEALRLSSF